MSEERTQRFDMHTGHWALYRLKGTDHPRALVRVSPVVNSQRQVKRSDGSMVSMSEADVDQQYDKVEEK